MEETFEIADLIVRKLNGSISNEDEKRLEEWADGIGQRGDVGFTEKKPIFIRILQTCPFDACLIIGMLICYSLI